MRGMSVRFNKPKTKKYPKNKNKSKRKRWHAILSRLKNNIPLLGAEIGIWNGSTSHNLLKARPFLNLIMIDPWKVPGTGSSYAKSDDDNANKSQNEHDKSYRRTLDRVKFAGKRAIIKKMMSHEAVKQVKDKSLDFVFIDGDHSYDGCRKDIILWLPKIKNGGFISGHDYNHPRLPGVKKAVNEMFLNKCIELDDNRTWFVRICK